MTSQAVYCLSLQIRPSAEEGNATVSAANGGGNEQLQQQLTVKPVAVASSGTATVVTSGTTTMVTSAIGGAGTLLSGLEKSGVTISAEASRALQSHAIQIAQSQVVTTGSSPATVTVATSQQHHHHQPQQQQQQHSNIILVRGSRSENGQIILQNTHELLSLLSDEDKPIFLQHQRLTTASSTAVAGKAQLTKALSESGAAPAGSTILFQPTIKSGSLDGGGSSTILLQSSDGGLKKGTTLDVSSASAGGGGGGPIFLQQRLSKNGTEGPILLRTLKRLDKSQSILVIRNATTASTIASAGHTTGGLSVSTAGGATLAKVKPISTPTTTVVTVTASSAGSSAASMAAAVARKAAEEAEEKKETTVTVTKVQHKSSNMPLGTDGEPIKLPDNLESLPRADHFPTQRHRWNTNEEIAAILISFDKHSEWQSKEVKTRPKSGSMLLYSRKKVRYRRDGYCWKKRKDGKTTREDHMKLKVQGTECIYGCYVHSAILPTFHRRCYWLLQNPDIVLVHYLNVPYPDDNKMAVITPNLALWGDKKEWTKEELVSQLKPMFFSEDEPDTANEIEISTAETVEAIVSQLMEKQRQARQSALVKQLECGCPDANCADGKSCSHPMRRISAAKTGQELGKRTDGHGAGTAPNVLIGSRMYPRWLDNRRMATGRVEQQQQQQQQHQQQQQQQQQLSQHTILDPNGARAITPKTLDSSIHFQVIPTSSQSLTSQNAIRPGNQNASSLAMAASLGGGGAGSAGTQLTSVGSHITNGLGGAAGNHLVNRSAMIITSNQHQQQQQQQHHQQHPQHLPNGHPLHGHSQQHSQSQQQQPQHHSLTMNATSNSSSSTTNSSNSGTSSNSNGSTTGNQLTAIGGHSTQVSSVNGERGSADRASSVASVAPSASNGVSGGAGGAGRDANINLLGGNESRLSLIGQTAGQNLPNGFGVSNQRPDGSAGSDASAGGSGAGVNSATNSNGLMTNGNGQGGTILHNRMSVNNPVSSASVVTSTPPLVLSLGQNLGTPGSLLILNGQQQSFVCQSQHQKPNDKDSDQSIKREGASAKQEMMDASSSPVPSLSHQHQQQQARQSSTQSSSGSSSSSVNGTASSKQSFESIFGYQNHTPMASPVQGGMENGGGGSGGSGHHHDNLPFFNETLDLSQEDIQKTLSANMPLGGHVPGHDSAPTDDAMNGEINPMDFIENCGDNHGTVDDDVFVNLDAFDMLVEFPELELDAKSEFLRDGSDEGTDETAGGDSGSELSQFKLSSGRNAMTGGQQQHQQHQQQQQQQQTLPNVSTITDFSPEWAYPEGGIKVLVTGPWSASSAYTVLFDSFPVPTTLVQDGVLRCYCPAHEVGVVTLQVACDGFVISNAVNFEYKSPPKFETKCEGNGNDMLYKFNLLNRLESIDEKLQIKVEPGELPEDTLLFKQNNFEDRLVNYCETLTSKMWRSVTPGPFIDKHQGMTLLHLAAALGYAKLVRTMLTWKAENSNVILEAEIDALSQDKDGHTPLTLACARGHMETAIMLYKWNQNALNVRTNAQKSPVEVARDYGHGDLARELERQEKERISTQQRTPTSTSIPTLASISSSISTPASSSTGAASGCTSMTLPASASSNHSSGASSPSASPSARDASDLLSNLTDGNSNAAHSGEVHKGTDSNNNLSHSSNSNGATMLSDAASTMHNFLNLNQIFSYGEGLHGANSDSCSNDNFGLVAAFNPSLSPNALSPYSDMKGSCSSSSGSQQTGLHYGLENTNSNPMLSNALSPNSDSNRSHDGVFLRPGAVYSSQSPPGARLSKRSSIDSGINMDSRTSSGLSRTGKTFRDAQRTNRMDRSMSLPLASGGPQGGGAALGGKNLTGTSTSSGAGGDRDADSFSLSLGTERTTESPSQISSNNSLLSPLRKMDFALCEVSATETSPMCEDADSLQEDDCHHQHPDSMDMGQGGSGNGGGAVGSAVGDSDAKVLTLAEQIIAAMPERIKNESEETMYLGSPLPESLNEDTSGMGILNDTFMEPLLDSLPSSQFDQEFNFEFSDHNYRYHDVGTPCSSLSPASSGPLQSPASYSIPQDHPVGSPSPPPTTQDFTEFLQSTNTSVRPFEADFSNLKLNDREQRELYEAAKCIQKAYRSYKGRKSRMEEQDKERTAAVVIQNYYRRYKQYAYFRQMTQAALVIQNGYRSYCENKRFKKSQTAQQNQLPVTSSEEDKASSQCIETYYQNFRNEQKQQQSPQQQQQNNQQSGSSSKEPSPSGPLKRTYSQRTQNQAARKIQQFMRQSKNKLQRERAEKERLVHLRRVEYLQSLQCLEAPEAQLTNDPK